MKTAFPELLAPAGSPDALDAALESGADAIYLGATAFNARMNAKNFTRDDLRAGVRRAHALGASVYMTLNTQIYDRELPAMLDAARAAYEDGIDALIIADLGAARIIHRVLPEFPLHASTQTSGHSTDMGRLLADCGYTRMVLARETSEENIRSFCENAPIEAEVFLHGALCVSHSGQCLFSSVVGGRSGNRGECAQPCRLPYAGGYPLSLRDLCLARQIPALIDMGVASLKIEGRMKSPEYVGAVTKIYRRLLDERRAATEDEVAHLSEIFSRGGFTDGYFRNRIGAEMLGVRSESDKEASRALAPFKGLTRTVPVSLAFTAKKDEKISLTMSSGERSVTVKGSVPLAAERAPTDRAAVERQITKLGGTVYSPASVSIDLDDGLMIPVGWLNALRRDAVAAFSRPDADPIAGERTPISYADPETALRDAFPNESGVPRKERKVHRSARFLSPVQITPRAKEYFDVRYLPLFCFRKDAGANGVILPPVVYDSRRETVKAALIGAVRDGATHVLLTNLGQCALIREAETETGTALTVTGDFRLGVTNRYALDFVRAAGVGGAILSPELTLPQLRDLSACGSTETTVYGRLPLMLLEKCVNIGRNGKKTGDRCVACMKNHEGCDNENAHIPSARLVDRKRVEFPVLREWEHRNVIYNSVPTYMADRVAELVRARISEWHFLFSVESPDEVDRVIDAYKKGTPPKGAVRRI